MGKFPHAPKTKSQKNVMDAENISLRDLNSLASSARRKKRMSYVNETMPEWTPVMRVDEIAFKRLEMEREFYMTKYNQVVRQMENMVDACKDYGYVELEWREKKFRFTMEIIN